MELTYVEIIGYIGSAFTLSAVFMKTMIPLRFFGMCSNAIFIVYAFHLNLPSIMIVSCILLPLNGFRFFQMRKLVRDVKASASGDLSVDWLLPYMSKITDDVCTIRSVSTKPVNNGLSGNSNCCYRCPILW